MRFVRSVGQIRDSGWVNFYTILKNYNIAFLST